MPKIETSKILLILTNITAGIVMVATLAAVFILRETSALAFLIPSVFGLTASVNGFYLWKAKNENLAKYGGTVADTDDIDFKEEGDIES